jgi:type I restriction enzyme S subunit
VVPLRALLREPLRNGHSAPESKTGTGIRTLTLTAVTKGDFSEANTKLTTAEPSKVDELWLQDGDILIERSNTPELVGTAGLYRGASGYAIFPDLLIRVRPVPELDVRWLTHYLQSSKARNYFRSSAQGIAGSMPKISQGTIERLEVPVPPLAEQRRIVDAVESHATRLTEAELGLRHVRRNLQRYRASVLKAAVEGRLVPTEAELARAEGRDFESAAVLLGRILAERRLRPHKARYEEPVAPDLNDLPLLPEGWCWASVDQLATLVRNGFSGKPAASGDVRILRISAVRSLAVDLSDARWLPGAVEEYSSDLVRAGDLLFTRYNGTPSLVGIAGLVRSIDRPTVHPDKLIKVRFASADVDGGYLEIAVNTGDSRRHIERRTRTTAGQAGVSGSDIKQMPVPLPPFAEQVRIAREVERLLTLSSYSARAVKTSTERTAKLRQSVLKWAFEGQLVDQDPSDEPAALLLERIRAERQTVGTTTRPRGRRKKTEATSA